MKARTLVVVAVAVLLVAAMPASAANLVVVSHFTTGTDFNSAETLDGVAVVGSGDSASVALSDPASVDNFEDGDVTTGSAVWSGWAGDTGSFEASSTDPISGSFSGVLDGTGGSATVNATVSQPVTATINYSIRPGSVSGSDRVRMSTGGTRVSGVVFASDGNLYHEGASNTNLGSYTAGQVYEITHEWNFATDEVTLTIDGTEEGTFDFYTSTNDYDEVEVQASSSETTVDDIVAGSAASATGTYVGANHSVSDVEEVRTNLTLQNAQADVTIEAWAGGQWVAAGTGTFTASGNKSIAVSQAADRYRTNVSFEATAADFTAELHDESYLYQTNDPQADESSISPTGGTTIQTSPVTFEVDVSDTDFGTTQGDSLTAEVVDDSDGTVGSDTVNSNGTATVQWAPTGGGHTYHWEITDQYGNTVSTSDHTFSVPATLYVRNESNVSDLVDDADADLTIRVYGGNQIVEKQSNDGKVDMTGFPVGTELVISASADGYYSRRIIVDSVLEQRSIYLLPENESAVYNEFVTVDRTGLFSSNDTKIYIEKGINNSSTTQWQTVAGDYRGASSRFGLYLQQDARYRVFVENDRGDVRNLGPYIASSPGTVELEIGNIIWESPEGETWQFDAYIREQEGSPDRLVIVYEDPEKLTESLRIRVFERGNESNELLPNTTETDVTSYGTELVLVGENESKQWVVDWSAERNGSTIGQEQQAGRVNAWDWPIDQKWATPLGMAACVAFAAWFPSTKSRVAALLTTAFATGLAWLGIVPIPMPIIGLMGALSLIGLAWKFGGVR